MYIENKRMKRIVVVSVLRTFSQLALESGRVEKMIRERSSVIEDRWTALMLDG